MKAFTYVITDKAGVHARPAGMIVKEAQKFDSSVTVKADKGCADAKKLMQLMSLGVRRGDEITVKWTALTKLTHIRLLKKYFKNVYKGKGGKSDGKYMA